MSKQCKHTPCPKGYLEWHTWADKMTRTHRQIKCPVCKRYTIWVKKEIDVNLVDAKVVEILSAPEYKFGKWFVKAKVSAYGRESETEQMFSSKGAADKFTIGDTVQI